MNIDRALPQLGIGPATGDTRRSSSQADAPAFSLDAGSQGAAQERKSTSFAPRDTARAEAAVQAARARASSQPARERANVRATDDVPHEEAAAKPQEAVKPDAARGPHDAAKSSARAERGASAPQDEAVEAPTDASSDAVAAADDTHASAKAVTDDALPDRMLALLSGDWAMPTAAPPPASISPATTDTSAVAAPLAATAGPSQIGVAPVLAGIATVADTVAASPASVDAAAPAVPPVLPDAPMAPASPLATTAAGVALAALEPSAQSNAGADAASNDAFAALAALAEGAGERNAAVATSTDTGTPATPGLAFNTPAARGADTLQTVTRAVAVAGPTSIPLALDAAFDDGMGSRILWMADQRVDRAEIRLNPDSLGPIDVRLQMDGHRLNAQFHSANADVRQALESGMDRLRDMLGRQGMELGQAQVGTGARQGDGRQTASNGNGSGGEAAAGEPHVTTVRALRSRGLLDEYA